VRPASTGEAGGPPTLEAGLHLDAALKKGSLSGREIEAVKLVVSEVADCDYCLAAHTMIGKMQGLNTLAMAALRRGEDSGDAKLDALSSLARALVETRGLVPADVLDAVRRAGFPMHRSSTSCSPSRASRSPTGLGPQHPIHLQLELTRLPNDGGLVKVVDVVDEVVRVHVVRITDLLGQQRVVAALGGDRNEGLPFPMGRSAPAVPWVSADT